MTSTSSAKKEKQALLIDDGNRMVEVVCHSQFKKSARNKSLKVAEQVPAVAIPKMTQKFDKGDVIVIDDQELLPKNTPGYLFPFLIGEVADFTDATDQTQPPELVVQILRPCDLKSIEKKFVKWIGDDNKHWRTAVRAASVKLAVELTPKGRTLTAKSLELLKAEYSKVFLAIPCSH